MTNLKDVIHLYIGCDIHTGTGTVQLIAIQIETIPCESRIIVLNGNQIHQIGWGDKCKLILRKLESITDEEKKEFQEVVQCEREDLDILSGGTFLLSEMKDWAQGVLWLTKKGFDIFGLIESGQAIIKQ